MNTHLFERAAALAKARGATTLSLTYEPQHGFWTVDAGAQLSNSIPAADGGLIRLTNTYLETPTDQLFVTLDAALEAFCACASGETP